jgi:hypothetical protein
MTVPPQDSGDATRISASPSQPVNRNCDYIPHPDGVHEMVIRVASVEAVNDLLAQFSVMYAATLGQERQLILIQDQTKTGLPLTALFPRMRNWLREHPLHPNPRVAVLFGHNNLIGMLGSFLGSMGISPRRVRMWKPNQREAAIAWLLDGDAQR